MLIGIFELLTTLSYHRLAKSQMVIETVIEILPVVQLLPLVFGFAGQIHTQLPQHVLVHL